jgi:hypothetical protein
VETTKPFSLLADSEPDVADKGKQSSEVETTNPVPAVENAEARKLMTQGTQSSLSKPLSGLVLNSEEIPPSSSSVTAISNSKVVSKKKK